MIKKILKYPFKLLISILPRNRKLWITGNMSKWEYENDAPAFFDNSKYLFLYLLNHTDSKAYWLSSSEKEIRMLKSMGLPVVRYPSLRGYWLTLRAKYSYHHYGIDLISQNLQRGSVRINLWHGTPLKKIARDVVPVTEKRDKPYQKLLDGLNKGDYVISPSPYLSKKILAGAFGLPAGHAPVLGYPRTDVLGLSRDELICFCRRYSRELLPYISIAEKYSYVFIYMPTWRDDDREYFAKANIDLEALSKALSDMDAVFFIKLHPLTADADISGYDNIIKIRNDADIYPFLPFTDALVTDYSSIYFDYLMLDREIVFIPYDFENYTKNRELYFDYDKVTPGKKYSSFSSFIAELGDIGTMDHSSERNRIKKQFIKFDDHNASERLYRYFSGRD